MPSEAPLAVNYWARSAISNETLPKVTRDLAQNNPFPQLLRQDGCEIGVCVLVDGDDDAGVDLRAEAGKVLARGVTGGVEVFAHGDATGAERLHVIVEALAECGVVSARLNVAVELGVDQARLIGLAEGQDVVEVVAELLAAAYEHHKAVAPHHIFHFGHVGVIAIDLLIPFQAEQAEDLPLERIDDERALGGLAIRAINGLEAVRVGRRAYDERVLVVPKDALELLLQHRLGDQRFLHIVDIGSLSDEDIDVAPIEMHLPAEVARVEDGFPVALNLQHIRIRRRVIHRKRRDSNVIDHDPLPFLIRLELLQLFQATQAVFAQRFAEGHMPELGHHNLPRMRPEVLLDALRHKGKQPNMVVVHMREEDGLSAASQLRNRLIRSKLVGRLLIPLRQIVPHVDENLRSPLRPDFRDATPNLIAAMNSDSHTSFVCSGGKGRAGFCQIAAEVKTIFRPLFCRRFC